MSIIEQSAYEAELGAREAAPGDQPLVEALRRGDESAFAALIERHHAALLRLAMIYVPSRAVAEEVVQETWLGVLQGLGRFEGRSSLKTWLFRILVNRARTRGEREGRCIPFASVAAPDAAGDEPAVEADRFLPPGHEDAGWWVSYPRDWDAIPERRLLAQETRAHIQRAIEALPASQREVITLRDVEGWSSDEVCQALHLSSGNERVLLHRARSKVRGALEAYLADE